MGKSWKIHYFNGHFPLLFVGSPEGNHWLIHGGSQETLPKRSARRHGADLLGRCPRVPKDTWRNGLLPPRNAGQMSHTTHLNGQADVMVMRLRIVMVVMVVRTKTTRKGWRFMTLMNVQMRASHTSSGFAQADGADWKAAVMVLRWSMFTGPCSPMSATGILSSHWSVTNTASNDASDGASCHQSVSWAGGIGFSSR